MVNSSTANREKPTLVLVADSKAAQVYAYQKPERDLAPNALTKLHSFRNKAGGSMPGSEINGYQKRHDWRNKSPNGIRTDYDLTSDSQEDETIANELTERFIKSIATMLEHTCTGKAFDRLVMIAPEKMAGQLRDNLSRTAQERIVGVIPKNLTSAGGADILDHMQKMIGQAQFA